MSEILVLAETALASGNDKLFKATTQAVQHETPDYWIDQLKSLRFAERLERRSDSVSSGDIVSNEPPGRKRQRLANSDFAPSHNSFSTVKKSREGPKSRSPSVFSSLGKEKAKIKDSNGANHPSRLFLSKGSKSKQPKKANGVAESVGAFHIKGSWPGRGTFGSLNSLRSNTERPRSFSDLGHSESEDSHSGAEADDSIPEASRLSSLGSSSPPWTTSEDQELAQLMEKMPNSTWAQLAEALNSTSYAKSSNQKRTAISLHHRYQTLRSKEEIGVSKNFTPDEDAKLLELEKWSNKSREQIADTFNAHGLANGWSRKRNESSLRHRHHYLMKLPACTRNPVNE
jgi:hypothetical protein